MKQKIAILGGAFDPITRGHTQLAQFVLNNCDIDYVWLMPCYEHIFDKKMVSPEHRFNMCKLVESDHVLVNNFEIRTKFIGSTYDMLKMLFKLKVYIKDYEFFFIIGMDEANNFYKWKHYIELQNMIKFIVVSRQGEVPKDNDWYLREPHVYLQTDSILKVSSSEVRTLLKDTKTNINKLTDHLNTLVLDYIISNNLYV